MLARSSSTDRAVSHHHQNDANGKVKDGKRPRQLHRQLAILCLIAVSLSCPVVLLHRLLSQSARPAASARRSGGPDLKEMAEVSTSSVSPNPDLEAAVAAMTLQLDLQREDLQRLRSSVGLQKEALQRQKEALDKSRAASRRLELVTFKQVALLEAQLSALQQPQGSGWIVPTW